MKTLMTYQEEAVDKLKKRTKDFLEETGNETIVFQAPTGAGKTFMATKYMEEIVKEVHDDLCFLWVSIGKGELHKQSLKAVKREISSEMTCSLLENEFFGSRKEIEQNEIVFASWQKIKLKDNATGEWKAVVMKEKESINFIEVLENTREIGRKIILIIDESHAGAKTEKSLELIDEIIKPEMTIEMSATPIVNKSDARIEVDPSDVIEAGIIKKEVIINKDIDLIPNDEYDSQQLIMMATYTKREALAEKYKKIGSKVNPLVLIQLPNSNAGEDIRIEVENFLREKGITEENGKLAIWLSDEKVNDESDKLLAIDGQVEYLIFKQAIDTGWDCPRAQILVRFRETNSLIFEIQTVGRILRMPETYQYDDHDLNIGYVYTNIKSIEVKKETYNPNIIKTCIAKRRDIYEPLKLRSYYRQRTDFGDVTSAYTDFFCKSFADYFMIPADEVMQDYYTNMEKLKQFGIKEDFDKMDSIIKNGVIDSETIDKILNNSISGDTINVEMSGVDLQYAFEQIIKNNLNGLAPRRSISTVKSAIFYAMKKYLNLNTARGGIIYIQNLVVKNENKFAQIIDESIKKYKEYHEEEVASKDQDKWNDEWEIEATKNYNPQTITELDSKLSLYHPLYVAVDQNGKVNQLEKEFIKYLDDHSEYIEWYWENGAEHMEKNFGIKVDNKKTFQPDFIVKFKDGRIGIFDTKGGMFKTDDKVKSNALQRYIIEETYKGKNLIGGLVIKDFDHFRVFMKDGYIPFDNNPEEWEYFDNLLK
ncbi:MAG: DEAD/DEAH box helicase family protein [Bacilli bacterium]|nr:DEAD/DEAH box helicase family protein [Bacilli bacterium]